jgi:RES domain-containing protein
VKLWRIGSETRFYAAHDLSGAGAAKYPGRWNDESEKVVYCAPSISLAVLETVAHLDDGGLPQNRYLVEIDAPDAVWDRRIAVAVSSLPIGWDAVPAGLSSVRFGSDWLRSKKSALILVPSVIVPEESVVLVNAAHADAARITAKKVRKYEYQRVRR